MLAARQGHLEVVRALLDAGAAVELQLQNNNGGTALVAAAQTGKDAVVELLHQRGAALDTQGSDNETALHLAVNKKHIAVIEVSPS